MDPIAEFEAWLAAQPWGASVGVHLKRGHVEPDDIHLLSFAVPGHLRGNGHASAIMAKLAEVADTAGAVLTLEVSEESESSEWLQSWYERLGYEEHNQGFGEWGPLMFRPLPTPALVR